MEFYLHIFIRLYDVVHGHSLDLCLCLYGTILDTGHGVTSDVPRPGSDYVRGIQRLASMCSTLAYCTAHPSRNRCAKNNNTHWRFHTNIYLVYC